MSKKSIFKTTGYRSDLYIEKLKSMCINKRIFKIRVEFHKNVRISEEYNTEM